MSTSTIEGNSDIVKKIENYVILVTLNITCATMHINEMFASIIALINDGQL